MTRPLLRLAILVAALAGATWSPRPAAAQAPGDDAAADTARARAKAHFDRAERMYALSRFDEALSAYEDAYSEVPAPGLLFNIAQCHRHLGNLDKAIFAYQKYLYHLPDAPNRKQVERTVARLERERDRRAAAQRGLTPTGPPGDRAPRRADTPIYKKWWFIAGAVVVVGATATVIATSGDDLPDSDLGVLDFRK